MSGNQTVGQANQPVKQAVNRALQDDRWVIELTYQDRSGSVTTRVVSPIRWQPDGDSFLALCLCREMPRLFKLKQCRSAKLIPEHEVMMPSPIQTAILEHSCKQS